MLTPFLPSLWDLRQLRCDPALKTPGYFHFSLWDNFRQRPAIGPRIAETRQ